MWQEKQQALGDHLDLASYLLKPIQRMSKYALLLQELARACGGPAQELGALQAAQSLVHFQLRHGNDLLAMDAIQGCDVSHPRPCGEALWIQKRRVEMARHLLGFNSAG